MSRKGENIHERNDGRWEGRFIDYRKPDGKPHYKSVYGESYTKVKSVLKEEMQKNQGKPRETSDRTVDGVSDEWLGNAKIKIKPSSYSDYYGKVKTHIEPYFKDIPLYMLTVELIEEFIKAKIKQGLSAKTIHDIISVLMQIIKYAEKRNYIEPFKYDIDLPKIQAKQLTVITPVQQKELVNYINVHLNNDTVGILIALYSGVRLGELCALTWENINFETQEIIVLRTIQRIKNTAPTAKSKTRLIIDTPKSKKSIRNIPLPEILLNSIKELGEIPNKNKYVLTGTAKPADPRTYQGKFKGYIKNVGLESLNFHALRHTFATRAIEVGFDIKSLSEILGHSSVKFTLDRYVHSSQEQKKICMSKMNFCY